MLKRSIVVFGLIIPCSLAFSQLPPITVNGIGGGYGGYGDGGYSPAGGQLFSGYYELTQLIRDTFQLMSVRCSGGAYRDVTSLDPPDIRWLAAESVFRAVMQTQSLWKRWGGSPFFLGGLTVVYADGGQEIFPVINPYFSSALSPASLPGTLIRGSGQIEPHAVCN